MPDGCIFHNAWDSCLAQRHTSTCKRTKCTESSISAHELSPVIQAFGNLNSVALDTFAHDSPPTVKAFKILSEEHSFCERLNPLQFRAGTKGACPYSFLNEEVYVWVAPLGDPTGRPRAALVSPALRLLLP